MKTKILFIGTFLSESTGTRGAAEKISDSLINEYGFAIKLVSSQENKFFRLLDIMSACLWSKYKTVHIDVFSNQAFIITEVASFICFARKKRIILTLRGGALAEFYEKNPKRVLKAFSRANLITTPSRMLKSFFEKEGFNITYLPNAVNLTNFPYNRTNIKPYSLLWVRAFDPIYNPQLAVEALFFVRQQYPDATLTMIGPDKGTLEECHQLILAHGLQEAVTIRGPVDNDKLYQYYQTHAVFLNTTSYESFGVAVMEAAACGIPIVSSKVGEIPYLWTNGENILMAEQLEAELFAEQILRIFEDKALAEKLSIQARKKAEEFNSQAIISKWIDLLKNNLK